jgi:hypothetical protein
MRGMAILYANRLGANQAPGDVVERAARKRDMDSVVILSLPDRALVRRAIEALSSRIRLPPDIYGTICVLLTIILLPMCEIRARRRDDFFKRHISWRHADQASRSSGVRRACPFIVGIGASAGG